MGNMEADDAELLRATIYARTLDAPRYDSAIVISERLLNKETVVTNPKRLQSLLELLVYSTRRLEDFELQLIYCTQLDDLYRQQNEHVEGLRTKAELGAVLAHYYNLSWYRG